MRLPQFSLKVLAGTVAFAAVTCCSLVYASSTWSAMLYTAAMVFLAFATLAAVYRRQRARAYWLGCAFCGWLYLLLIFGPLARTQQMSSPGQLNIDSELATTHLSRWVYANVLPKLRSLPPRATQRVKLRITAPKSAAQIIVDDGGTVLTTPDVEAFLSTVNVDPTQSIAAGTPLAVVASAPAAPYYPDETSFVRVSHALWTWLFALAGGIAASRLYAKQAAPA